MNLKSPIKTKQKALLTISSKIIPLKTTLMMKKISLGLHNSFALKVISSNQFHQINALSKSIEMEFTLDKFHKIKSMDLE